MMSSVLDPVSLKFTGTCECVYIQQAAVCMSLNFRGEV